MQPHCKRDNQFELFNTAPTSADPTPKLALPFQRSAEIDVRRLSVILGVSNNTALRMVRAGYFRYYPHGGRRLIEYQSVVEYCDGLRLHYGISNATAPRPKTGRMRDRDLLPFPIDETIDVDEVEAVLDYSKGAVLKLIEDGTLVAYKLTLTSSPWRIHRPSLDSHIRSLHTIATTPTSRRAPTAR